MSGQSSPDDRDLDDQLAEAEAERRRQRIANREPGALEREAFLDWWRGNLRQRFPGRRFVFEKLPPDDPSRVRREE